MKNNRYKYRSSFRFKLVATMILLLTIFLFLTTYIWNTRTSLEAQNSAENYLTNILKVSNSNFEASLKDIDQLVAIIATNRKNVIEVIETKKYETELEELEDIVRIEDYITSLYSFNYFLSGILIGNLEGKTYFNTSSVNMAYVLESPIYENLLSSSGKNVFIPPNQTLLSSEAEKNLNRENEVSIARLIMNNGKSVGLVIAEIRSDLIKSIFNYNFENNSEIYVYDSENKKIIFTTDENPDYTSIDGLMEETDKLEIEKGSFYKLFNNEEKLVVYQKSNYTQWTSIGLTPRSVLLNQFNQTRDTLLIITLLFFVLALVIALILSSVLTRNLLLLSANMKMVDLNNLNITNEINSNDEIGELYFQFNNMLNKIRQLLNDLKNKEQEKRKAEIAALQAQINPHFLYNTLNTIRFLATVQSAENIKKVTESLSTLLHMNMDSRIFISLREELECIGNYLNLQQYKYIDKFEFNISIEEGLDDYRILKLLLQPVVENAILHGVSSIKGQGIILIKVYRELELLKIRVQDNGAGIDEEVVNSILSQKNRESIGLPNVLSRIKMYFGNNYGITILSQKNAYTVVEFTLPIIKKDEEENYV